MGYFKDSKNKKSMGRLKVFMALTAAIVLAFVIVGCEAYFCSISTVEEPKDFQEAPGVTIVGSLLAFAGAVKIFQKREERKSIV